MRKLETRLRSFWIVEFSVIGFFIGLMFYWPLRSQAVAMLIPGVISALMFYYVARRYANWGFEVRDDHLYIQHGVLKKVYSMVPYVRIQHVDTQRTVIDRFLGLSRVVVYTAGSRGSDVRVPGLAPEEASEIQEKLRDLAIESEDRDAV
jgi:membrane protein YdbS with pleckstrin-like domain